MNCRVVWACTFLSLFIVGWLSCASTSTVNKVRSEWQLLEADDETWNSHGAAIWILSEDEIKNVMGSGKGFLISNERFENFVLHLEFYPGEDVNSGVFVRCATEDINPTLCYELNIWDQHPNQDNRTGAIVGLASPINHVETINKWNILEAMIDGGRIKIWINGIQTVDYQEAQSNSGYIALQIFSEGQVKFRDIKIRVL